MDQSSLRNDRLLGIKEVAQKTGLAPSTIRYYDQQFEEFLGLKRGAGRRRLFTEKAVDRLLRVHKMLKDEGLSLRQARQALSGMPHPGTVTPPNLSEEVEALRSEVSDLRRQLNELKDIQRRTLSLVSSLARS